MERPSIVILIVLLSCSIASGNIMTSAKIANAEPEVLDMGINIIYLNSTLMARAEDVLLCNSTEMELTASIDVRDRNSISEIMQGFVLLNASSSYESPELVSRGEIDASYKMRVYKGEQHRGENFLIAKISDVKSTKTDYVTYDVLRKNCTVYRNTTMQAPFSIRVGKITISSGDSGTGGLHVVRIDEETEVDDEYYAIYHAFERPVMISAHGTLYARDGDWKHIDPGPIRHLYYAVSRPRYSERSCNPRYECTNWGECMPEGYRYRECVRLSRCKGYEPLARLECTYEEEKLPEVETPAKKVLFDIVLDMASQVKDKALMSVRLVNFGDPGAVLATVTYSIYEGDVIVYSEMETKDVRTQLEYVKEIDVGHLKPGEYRMVLDLEYPGQVDPARAEKSFVIVAEEEFDYLLASLGLAVVILIVAIARRIRSSLKV